MAAAASGDSDGDSEELVLTPAQLIHSLEQVPWAGATGSGRGQRELLGALERRGRGRVSLTACLLSGLAE